MPSLADAIRAAREGGYIPVDREGAVPNGPAPFSPFRPRMRCPMPPVPMTPDTLQQADLGGQVPQRRTLIPSAPTSTGSSTTVNNTTVVTGSTSSGSTAATLTSASISFTMPAMIINVAYTTTVQMAKSFQLLYVQSDISIRVELYGTQTAQFADIVRAVDSTPGTGQNQNIITDVVMDTAPYSWCWQNRNGANNDDPQSSSIYVTVTALQTSGVDANVTIGYVPLES